MLQDQRALREILEQREIPGRKDPLELRVQQELKELLELQELKDQQDQRDLRAQQEQQVLPDPPDLLEPSCKVLL